MASDSHTLSVSLTLLLSEVDSGRTESFHATLVPHSDNAELADLADLATAGGPAFPSFHPSGGGWNGLLLSSSSAFMSSTLIFES